MTAGDRTPLKPESPGWFSIGKNREYHLGLPKSDGLGTEIRQFFRFKSYQYRSVNHCADSLHPCKSRTNHPPGLAPAVVDIGNHHGSVIRRI
jgi:hypothetical protein